MNDSLTDLGESLARAYRNKITHWSALEYNFSTNDLPATFGLADDILRLEDGLQAFVTLGQSLQEDFLPQDLLEASDTAASPGEQPAASSRYRMVENYPFALKGETSFGSTPVEFPAGVEQQGMVKQAAFDPNQGLQGRASDLPVTQRASSPNTVSENHSIDNTENSVKGVTGKISALPVAEIHKLPLGELFDPVHHQGLTGRETLSTPLEQTSLHTPAQENQDSERTFHNSIWTRPLQNLGDFALQAVQPPIEKNRNIKLSGLLDVSASRTDPASMGPHQQAEVESASFPENGHPPRAPIPDFEVEQYLPRPEYFLPLAETPGSNIEMKMLEQLMNHHSPDTDDLLEALTDRILRDFHRYYP